jgi:hypothetical protein
MALSLAVPQTVAAVLTLVGIIVCFAAIVTPGIFISSSFPIFF